jgi:hypothetical protein
MECKNKDTRIITDELDNYINNQYFIYKSNINNNLVLCSKSKNLDLNLKNKLIKIHNNVVIKYGKSTINSKIIFEFKKSNNYKYQLPYFVWIHIKQYMGLVNKKLNFTNVNNISDIERKTFLYYILQKEKTFNPCPRHPLYLSALENDTITRFLSIYNNNPFNINSNTKQDIYEFLSHINTNRDLDYQEQDIREGENILVFKPRIAIRDNECPFEACHHVYKVVKVNKKSLKVIKRIPDLSSNSFNIESIGLTENEKKRNKIIERERKKYLLTRHGYIKHTNIFTFTLSTKYKEINVNDPVKVIRNVPVFTKRNIPNIILNYLNNINLTYNLDSISNLHRRTERININSTGNKNMENMENMENIAGSLKIYNCDELIKQNTNNYCKINRNIFENYHFYYTLVEEKYKPGSRFGDINIPIYKLSIENKYMYKLMQNYLENSKSANVVHIKHYTNEVYKYYFG